MGSKVSIYKKFIELTAAAGALPDVLLAALGGQTLADLEQLRRQQRPLQVEGAAVVVDLGAAVLVLELETKATRRLAIISQSRRRPLQEPSPS